MLIFTILLPSAIVFVIGGLILWSNPHRIVNRVTCSSSVHVILWLLAIFLSENRSRLNGVDYNGLFWLRTACAIGIWLPFHFWIVKEAITAGENRFLSGLIVKSIPWVAISLSLSIICFTDFFIPSHSLWFERIRGKGYYIFIIVNFLLITYVIIDMFRDVRVFTGGRKLELQVYLGGGCITAFSVVLTMVLNAVTGERIFISFQPVLVLVFYIGTGYAITTYKIFDAYQLLKLGANKGILGAVVILTSFVIYTVCRRAVPEIVAFIPAIIGALITASYLESWLDRKLQYFPKSADLRQAAFSVARRESRADGLEVAFVNLIKGWAHTDHAIILSSKKGSLSGCDIEIPGSSSIVGALEEIRWATPERLAREKETPNRLLLVKFLQQYKLGVVVFGGTEAVKVLAGSGVLASRRPFTYPQVMQLLEVTEIFESAFERAQLSVKMQHTEQLATVGLLGASLAHEIRNPLVTIKTFVQLLPSHHGDSAFREKFFKLLGDEVARIDRLTEQLLDLAAPRTYSAHPLELHSVLRGGIELFAAKARERDVELVVDLAAVPDTAIADPSAVKQVLLNLCLNAIQALDSRPTGRIVTVRTRTLPEGIEMSVTDNGPGLPAEMHSRLFQPFQTTKSSGFGLGLAICRDILTNLGASISIDPPANDAGATFRVVFPCRP